MAIKIAGTEVIDDSRRYMSNENLPDIYPTLNLDFANSRVLDPRIDFSRSSTATYYDGVTKAKAEENYIKFSEDFTNGNWGKSNVYVNANSTIAPNGTLTADTITANGTSVYLHPVSQNITLTESEVAVSVYAKANTGSVLQILFYGSQLAWYNYDLTNGVLGSGASSGDLISADIIDVGNGWYRCQLVVDCSTNNAVAISLNLVNTPTTGRATTETVSGSIYLWGVQVEKRGSVTAYTPTTTYPITKYIPKLMTASNNEPRFDHGPVTGESKGLLMEEYRTNLLTYSKDLASSPWSQRRVSINTDFNIAPDGTQTADMVIANSETSSHYVDLTLTGTYVDGDPYTFTAYAKAGGINGFRLMQYYAIGSTGGKYAEFDLSTGTITLDVTDNGAEIIPVGNGWYRCSISNTVNFASIYPTTLLNRLLIVEDTTTHATTFTGNDYHGVYIWGAQLEKGYFATSYIPTSGTQVTRGTDSFYMQYDNFYEWYREEEGTFFLTLNKYSDIESLTTNEEVLTIKENGSSGKERIDIFKWTGDPTKIRFKVLSRGFIQCDIPFVFTPKTDFKIAGAYKDSSFAFAKDGVDLGTDGGGLNPKRLDTLASTSLNGHFKKLAYYPKRLSNETLLAMTEE